MCRDKLIIINPLINDYLSESHGKCLVNELETKSFLSNSSTIPYRQT